MRNRLTMLALMAAFSVHAQYSEGGLPPSFLPGNIPVLAGKMVAPVAIPSVDRDALLAEDTKTPGQTRFAAPVSINISLENAGVWSTLPSGQRLWQCAVRSPGGLGLTLLFDQFILPPGAKFFATVLIISTFWAPIPLKAVCLPANS